MSRRCRKNWRVRAHGSAEALEARPREYPDRLPGRGIPEFQYLVRLLPRDAMAVTECGTRRTSFRPQVADSLGETGRSRAGARCRPLFDGSDTMSTILFQFSRKLKISRFTIDVLMERLTNLRPPRQ